jgi:acyl-CoA synthetase (AMP-forming)/AMP-acid ligase II
LNFYQATQIGKERIIGLDDLGNVLTWNEVESIASRFRQEVQPQRVGLVLTQNSIDCFAGIVALMNCGVVPLLVDLNSDVVMIQNLINVYSPEYLYVPSSDAKTFTGFAITILQGEYSLCSNKQQSQSIVHHDLALLLSTSGSTGSPRLVRQSHSNLKSNGSSIIEYLGITSSDRPITSLPMHYTY